MLKDVIIVALVLLAHSGGSSQETKTIDKKLANVTRIPAVLVTPIPKNSSQKTKSAKKPLVNVSQTHFAAVTVTQENDCEVGRRYVAITNCLNGLNDQIYARREDHQNLDDHFTLTFNDGSQWDKSEFQTFLLIKKILFLKFSEKTIDYVNKLPQDQNINVVLKVITNHTDNTIEFGARIYGPGHQRHWAVFLYSVRSRGLLKGDHVTDIRINF
ncbi:hypothetical protein CAEBREN_23795 [Caenorhabditis brenneri]|uniref:Uncharacterized protein n=1 Tax=Caenorhabditis brenneri TaxID=135651 RepID=G0NGC0_CAEBE|nr:hypothetical protein CAEBREN_23795 [Caenorhabditis brenneri]